MKIKAGINLRTAFDRAAYAAIGGAMGASVATSQTTYAVLFGLALAAMTLGNSTKISKSNADVTKKAVPPSNVPPPAP